MCDNSAREIRNESGVGKIVTRWDYRQEEVPAARSASVQMLYSQSYGSILPTSLLHGPVIIIITLLTKLRPRIVFLLTQKKNNLFPKVIIKELT